MKKTIIIVLIVLVVSILGFGIWWVFSNRPSDGENDLPVDEVEQNEVPVEDEENEVLVEVDYPTGDQTPEHVAEILGSQEAYEELWNSKLRKPTESSMQIVYDSIGGPGEERRIAWVALAMEGEVVDILEPERIITITAEGDTDSLYVVEFATINKLVGHGNERHFVPLTFEDIKEGDWFFLVSVVVNAGNLHLPEARYITISEISQK
ncbi:hypothetical protein ES705_18460 [subsurface metagenome]